MPAKRSGLGRGLDALLPKPEQSVQQLPVAELKVSPYQPRKSLDPEGIAELAASIRDKGILQPLLVRPTAGGYEIVAGERRYRAAIEAGLTSVPVVVRTLDDQATLEIAIIENLQREDLNPVEEAHAFQQLMEFGLNQEAVAKAVGKSRSAVANTLRLLHLPTEALDALAGGRISAGHARALLALPEEDRAWGLERILDGALSVREAEALKRQPKKGAGSKPRSRPFRHLEEEMARVVGTKVRIAGGTRGKVELFYHSEDELTRLLELLGFEA